jgi:hypothetical protein
MHPNFADWYKSVGAIPPEGRLQARWTAVEALSEEPSSAFVAAMVRIFARPDQQEHLIPDEFLEAVREADDTFSLRNNYQEVRVLAGAVLRHIIEGYEANDDATLAALGILSASFGARITEVAEPDHVKAASTYIAARSRELRANIEIATVKIAGLTKEKYASIAPASSFAANATPPLHDQLYTLLDTVIKNWGASVTQINGVISSLQQKIAAQDEELNILWWLQGAVSVDLNKQFSEIGPHTGCLIFPVELHDLTRIIPGPSSILGILLKSYSVAGGKGERELTSIANAVNATPREWRSDLKKRFKPELITEASPILLAITKSLDTQGPDEWLPVYKAISNIKLDEEMSVLQLSLQLYNELAYLRLLNDGD